MLIRLHPELADDASAVAAASAAAACVHCGFCLATCPTYLDSRDERDSPRGRIVLAREMLESGDVPAATSDHLDRCLTCRACETTCPSGVQYGVIADGARDLMERRRVRPLKQRWLRGALRAVVPYRGRFTPLLRAGQLLRPLLPPSLKALVPPRQHGVAAAPTAERERRVVLLEGCVQCAATPGTNAAARRILDRLGISVVPTPAQGCCGALDSHLGYGEAGRAAARRNVDAWSEALEAGAEAVISTATGCGSQLADYGGALAADPGYAGRAAAVAAKSRDLASFLLQEDLGRLGVIAGQDRIAVHVPCSQSHALGEAQSTKALLSSLGFKLAPTRDDHLCCGSAGTYSLLQPAMAGRLRERKLTALSANDPQLIVTANVGCQLHLAAASTVPVRHWAELVDDALPGDF
jgi:glycolate oxidase iron-sulfur subunit